MVNTTEYLSTVMLHNIDELVFTLLIVLFLGSMSLYISRKSKVSFVPLFIMLGLLVGPLLRILDIPLARKIFDYVRVFGLVVILFAEGHNLKWYILRKHLETIAILDTISLVVTAFCAGLFFSWIFNVPFIVGLLFGAIISATDPATLIPLFHEYKVREDIKTVLVTESIFNDPLGIVLTSLTIALLVPQAPSASFVEKIASFTGIGLAGVMYFIYEVSVSIIIGIMVGIAGYWAIRLIGLEGNEEVLLFSLALAFLGFYFGEVFYASGYLAATIIGIILGNHHVLFKEDPRTSLKLRSTIDREVHFNEILSLFSIVFIFILLGASTNLRTLIPTLLHSIIVALSVILLARPLALIPVLATRKWDIGEYLFMALEGPRGVVPSALSALPLSLAVTYNIPKLMVWGEYILGATLTTVILSIILETSWLPILGRKLLGQKA